MTPLAKQALFAAERSNVEVYTRYAEAQKHVSYETLAAARDAGQHYEDIIAELTEKGSALLPLAYRDWFVIYFAWAIPNAEALDYLCQQSPIIEVGAGSGYWAHRIAELGGEITAWDPKDWLLQGQHLDIAMPEPWYPCERVPAHHVEFPPPPGIGVLKRYPTLFMCWPGFLETWPAKLLERFPGNQFIYVGDDSLCANDEFHDRLDTEWEIRTVIEIPQFMSIRDRLVHYRRK